MSFSAEIVADSTASYGEMHRLTTFVIRYPRFIHSELMTHRALSRNASSSRAIPVNKMISSIEDDPAMPVYWGKNKPGMQATTALNEQEENDAKQIWIEARDNAIASVDRLVDLGVHKQIANRLLEPWMHITVVVSATEWANFFALRLHKDAQPEFRHLAELMRDVYINSNPRLVKVGEWHLPFVHDYEINAGYPIEELIQASVARCARVSYLNHDGTAPVMAKDLELHDRLVGSVPLHASPAEHPATPSELKNTGSNFRGWTQYRKTIPNENVEQLPWGVS